MKKIFRGVLFVVGIVLVIIFFPQKTVDLSTYQQVMGENNSYLAYDKLPNGMSSSDIQITYEEEFTHPDFPGHSFHAYSLEPDGTEFRKDAYLFVPFDEYIPYYFHLHDDEMRFIPNVTYTLSETGNIAMIPLDGFSHVIETVLLDYEIKDAKLISFDVDIPDKVYMKEPVPVTIQAKMPATEYIEQYATLDPMNMYIDEGVKYIQGKLRTTGPLSPERDMTFPGTTRFTDTYTLKTSDIRCTWVGKGTITFEFVIDRKVQFTKEPGLMRMISPKAGRKETAIYRIKDSVECIEKPREPVCNNTVAEGNEACDTDDHRGKYCKDFGYHSGKLSCDKECEFDFSQCVTPGTYSCNENSRDPDDQYNERVDLCQDDCPDGMRCNPYDCGCIPIADTIGGREWFPEDENDYYKLGLPGVDDEVEEETKAAEKQMVDVIKYKKHYIPLTQIHSGKGVECDKEEHWHANSSEVKTLAGEIIGDPDSTGCGFGKTADAPVIQVEQP